MVAVGAAALSSRWLNVENKRAGELEWGLGEVKKLLVVDGGEWRGEF
jgi:hypothetical protein